MNRVVFLICFSGISLYFSGLLCAQESTQTQPKTSTQEKPAVAKPKPEANPVLASVTDVDGLPRVLLIGDSISMGYTLDVRELLAGKANVHRPPTNCGPTTNGIKSLDQWLSTGGKNKTWDVIHFNWGLHDLKYVGKDGTTLSEVDGQSRQQVPPEQYRKNLQELVRRLKTTNAKLIWRNTTPVPEGAKGRVVGDSVTYNQIAEEIMTAEDVQIHDLYAFAKEHENEIQLKADVHYTKSGSRRLAEQIAKVISEALEKSNQK